MKKFNKIIYIGGILLFSLVGCEKDFLDTNPGEYAGTDQLKTSPIAGEAALSGLYSFMFDQSLSGRDDYFGLASISITTDLIGKDMVQVLHHWLGWDYLIENRSAGYSRTRNNWNFLYRIISTSNSIIQVSSIDSEVESIKFSGGQALAMRAFAYHYLVRLYQHTYIGHEDELGVPLYLEDDVDGKPRATVREVYAQMVMDLEKSIIALEGFNRSNKTIINQSVAQGILARVYLDMGEWQKAATVAADAQEGFPLMTGTEYLDGFNDINNAEWLWGSDMTVESFNEEGKYQSFFSHIATDIPGYAGIIGAYKAIDKGLYDMIPTSDVRKNAYYANYYNNKYVDANGDFASDIVYMRAAEMYLIVAEAKAQLGNSDAAQILMDIVKTRDSEYVLSTSTGTALIDEIWNQRRIELWGEGFSWFDLKRLKKGFTRDYPDTNHRPDALLTKEAEDQSTFVYQLPIGEFESNPNLPENQQNN
ncbi:MAG: RagB/SusD family nutrient uptake outer membrane protein [Flavobacteriaceae bacterium]|nr:RagB/SusD family nutrient uptake outer membrane protein [Flavobacteriaceae bacterium]